MSTLIWVKTVRCDLCENQAELPTPSSEADGWERLDAMTPGGRAFRLDLCATCVTFGVYRVIEHLRKLDE